MNRSLQSSTLVESVIGMVIIAVSFSIALMTLGTVLNSHKSTMKFRVQKVLDSIIADTHRQQRYFDESMVLEDFLVQKKVTVLPHQESLFQISWEVLGIDGKLICEQREIIFFHE